MARLACLVAVALGLASVAGAQESRGTIQGTVKDSQGAVIAGANVTVTNTNTRTTVALKTSEVGRFNAPLLLPGPYVVTVEAAGFKKEVRQGIDLLTGDIRTLEVTLQIGVPTESVTITGEAPIIDVTHTDSGMVLDDRTVR